MRKFVVRTICLFIISVGSFGGLFLQQNQPHLFFRAQSLLSYLWHGKSRYHVHSDFVFQYINKVLRNKAKTPVFEQIEAVRKQLHADSRTIVPNGLGAKPDNIPFRLSTKAKQTGLPALYGRLLFNTAQYFNAKKILELGTATGISTMYLGAAGATRLVSLEGNRELVAIAQDQLNQLKLSNVELIAGDFNSTLSTALGKLGVVDMAFIDGDHQFASTIKYYEAILPYTHNDTVLVFDDINWSIEMQDAWQNIISRPEITLSLDFHRLGMVFFRKEFRQPQHLKLYYW